MNWTCEHIFWLRHKQTSEHWRYSCEEQFMYLVPKMVSGFLGMEKVIDLCIWRDLDFVFNFLYTAPFFGFYSINRLIETRSCLTFISFSIFQNRKNLVTNSDLELPTIAFPNTIKTVSRLICCQEYFENWIGKSFIWYFSHYFGRWMTWRCLYQLLGWWRMNQ